MNCKVCQKDTEKIKAKIILAKLIPVSIQKDQLAEMERVGLPYIIEKVYMTEEEKYNIWKELRKLNKKIDDRFEDTSKQIDDLKEFFTDQMMQLKTGGGNWD